MKKKHIWIISGLLVGLIAVTFLAYTYWPAGTEDRPTLMYFRADL